MRANPLFPFALALIVLAACPKEKADNPDSSKREDAMESAEESASAPSRDLGRPRLKFDYRVLSAEGREGQAFPVKWDGEIWLSQASNTLLKLGITMEMVDGQAAHGFKESNTRNKAVADLIKDVFRLRTLAELRGSDALERRREDLIEAINGYFGATVVRALYFTDYNIMRVAR